jgi:hypothetical protein
MGFTAVIPAMRTADSNTNSGRSRSRKPCRKRRTPAARRRCRRRRNSRS